MDDLTLVLIHGAGHTAAVWDETRRSLKRPSVAVNLPGRAGKAGDLSRLSVPDVSRSIADDVRTATQADSLILVGHSVSGVLLPTVASLLAGRSRHLVFVAGISAREGELPADVYAPGRLDQFTSHLANLRAQLRGVPLEELSAQDARSIDSLSLSCEPMRWEGLPASTPRTFVRCLDDRIQPREIQARLIDRCGAQNVFDIESGHTPAIEAPDVLAGILDEIADRSQRR